MKKKWFLCPLSALLAALLLGCSAEARPAPGESASPEAQEKVVLYTAMREDVVSALKAGFEEKYPEVALEYYNAASDTVRNRIYAEAQAGQVAADVLWVGDECDCLKFRELDILRQYFSPQAETGVESAYKDPEGYYIAGRIAAVGFAVNTEQVSAGDLPKTWQDLLDKQWEGRVALVDPAFSGAAEYWTCAMMSSEAEEYGYYYIRRLCRKGHQLESGVSALLRKVQAGDYAIGVCPDYLAAELIRENAPITFVCPEDAVVVKTPLALVKDSANMANGRLLYDYLISKEGQELMAANGLVSVRSDVAQSADPAAIARQAMDCDIARMAANKEADLAAFDELWGR